MNTAWSVSRSTNGTAVSYGLFRHDYRHGAGRGSQAQAVRALLPLCIAHQGRLPRLFSQPPTRGVLGAGREGIEVMRRSATFELCIFDADGLGRTVIMIRIPRWLTRRLTRWVNA